MAHDPREVHEFDELLTTEELEETRPRSFDDELDLTPMVDVTFLLLIFFMITAAFAASKAISVPPVSDESSQDQLIDPESDMITVRIDADNVYWISAPKWPAEEQALSAAAMRDKLRDARAGDAKAPNKVLVQAHGDCRHESVVAALDGAAGAGCEEIALMSYEDGDLDL